MHGCGHLVVVCLFVFIKFALITGWRMYHRGKSRSKETIARALQMWRLRLWSAPWGWGSGQRAEPKGLNGGLAIRSEGRKTPGDSQVFGLAS